MNDTICLCALNKIFGFEPRAARRLLEVFSPGAVFSMPREELREVLGPYSKYLDHINSRAADEAASELEALGREGCSFLPCTSDGFPRLLQDCPDAPLGLYVKGGSPHEQIFPGRDAIALVGTRDASPYGTEICYRLVQAIADTGQKPLIISGLAYGIDASAHSAALDCGLPTIAVMATGIDEVYPVRHRSLAGRIAQTGGSALITDYPPGTKAVAIHFLRRNRIIAGLSRATILVESRVKGGGMMTANLAFGYGREVFAVPGRIGDQRSAGCNHLLREKKAEPVTEPEALAAQLFPQGRPGRRRKENLEQAVVRCADNPDVAARLLELASIIKEERGITMDELAGRTLTSWADLSAMVALLESGGIISTDILQRCSICPKFV